MTEVLYIVEQADGRLRRVNTFIILYIHAMR
jgi:hypothetical protein